MSKSNEDGLKIIDIINFCILSKKYKGIMPDGLKEKIEGDDEIFESCKESFNDWLELMVSSQKTIFELFDHSQTVGYTEDFFKAMKEYKEIWEKGLTMMNQFSKTIDVISIPPGNEFEDVMESPKFLS
jgi:hypothetical protein